MSASGMQKPTPPVRRSGRAAIPPENSRLRPRAGRRLRFLECRTRVRGGRAVRSVADYARLVGVEPALATLANDDRCRRRRIVPSACTHRTVSWCPCTTDTRQNVDGDTGRHWPSGQRGSTPTSLRNPLHYGRHGPTTRVRHSKNRNLRLLSAQPESSPADGSPGPSLRQEEWAFASARDIPAPGALLTPTVTFAMEQEPMQPSTPGVGR